MFKKIVFLICLMLLLSNSYAWCSGTDCNTDWEYKQELELNTEGILTSDVTNEHAILVHVDSSNTDFWENSNISNIESYWNFNESSGDLLDQVHNNDGTNTNITYSQTGILNNSYSYNGSNSRTDTGINNINPSFSISAWFKRGTPSVEDIIFAKWNGLAVNNRFGIGFIGGTTDLKVNFGSINSWVTIASSTDTSWNNVILTYNGSNYSVWYNGSKVIDNVSATYSNNTGANLWFGDFGNGSGYYNGLIDETGYWNKVLSDTEIAEIYNNGSGSVPSFSQDVRFTNSDDSIDLNYHFELVDTDTNDLWAWVRVPDFDADANTTINMYYGNPNAIDNQNETGTYPADYLAVYHMNSLLDSTSNNNDFTQQSGNTLTQTDCSIGYCYDFTASGYLWQGSGSSVGPIEDASSDNFSVSIWYNADTSDATSRTIYGEAASSASRGSQIQTFSGNTRGRNTNGASDSTTDISAGTGTTYHALMTYNTSTGQKLYQDYFNTNTDSYIALDRASYRGAVVANTAYDPTSDLNPFDGTIDEIKVFNYTLSDDEASLIYHSEDSNLITFGAQEKEIGVTADFNYTNDASNSRVYLYDTSTDTNVTINSWTWKINGTTQSTDQNFYYSTSANQDLNTCLTASGLGTDAQTYSDTLCQSVLTWDTENPTIDVNITPSSFGFTNTFDINYEMTCYDNFSTINYEIIQYTNGSPTTIYDSDDTNASTKTDTISIDLGDAVYFIFNCNDAYNTATYTSDTYYAVNFNLVNEETGVPLTSTDIGTDFNSAKVFSPDGNFSFDFKDANNIDTNFFSTSNDLWFEFQYKDVANTKINRQIDFSYTDSSEVNICVPDFQTFYQQRFVANSAKAIVIKNDVSSCYIFSGQLAYAYDTGYSLTTYLIPLPYYLYTWIDGVKTYLALLDGGVATAYNIDAIIFSREGFTINVGQDTVAFEPLKNSQGIYDTNTIQIYYDSYDETNTKLELVIKDNSGASIWSYTEYSEPNELLVNFYWGGLDLNLDEILTLTVTKTNASGKSSSSNYYFTLYGGSYQNNVSNEWAVLIAVLFFLFGITLVAYDKALGLFGIIIGVVALFFITLASGAWWVSLLSSAFVIIIAYIFLLNRSGGSIK